MYDEEELIILDAEIGLEEPLDPLDQIEPLTDDSEELRPDPEEMLALLKNPQPSKGCWRLVPFVTLKMQGLPPI